MRKYFPQGVLWCKKPEREHGARQPLPLTAAVFFACAAMPRNRAKRDAKNSRSAERGCSSVLPPPNRRRMSTASNLALLPTGYAAQSRKARCKKQPERRALRPQARFGAQPPQAALGAEIGCSSVLPVAEQAANGWCQQPCLTPSRLCRAIAQRCTNSSPPQNAARRSIRR